MQEQVNLREDQMYALWLLLIQTNKAIHLARQEELGKIGITVSEAGILYYAQKLGRSATPAEISRRLSKLSHGVSALVSRMETDGLVIKVKDLDRKNMVRVGLTDKGREAHQKAAKREVIHQIMSSLSTEEFRQVTYLLEKVRNAALEKITLRRQLEYLGYEE